MLTNALLVFRYHGPRRPSARPPEGYQVRRSTAADARAIGRLVREVVPERVRAEEIERVLGSREGRGYVAMKAEVLVGFAAVEVRVGRGDWIVGVRDSHRRRGVGRALAQSVIGALHAREPSPFATSWALDPVAGPFLSALGFAVERTYLYVERPL
jgi:GNAT superfamily N-acetyltransferase